VPYTAEFAAWQNNTVMKAAVLQFFTPCLLPCQGPPADPADIDAKTEMLTTDANYRNAVLQGDAAKLAPSGRFGLVSGL
jgi:hypothetical protein